MLGYASLRKGRTNIPGQIYLVTFTTAARVRIFEDHDIARLAAQALTDRRLWYRSRLLAWVLMPDHWHGLIELGAMDSLSIIVQKLKSNSARHIRIEHPSITTVWEKGFHDRVLRTEAVVRPAARYIAANPLRAGLATSVGDYPYWDSIWL